MGRLAGTEVADAMDIRMLLLARAQVVTVLDAEMIGRLVSTFLDLVFEDDATIPGFQTDASPKNPNEVYWTLAPRNKEEAIEQSIRDAGDDTPPSSRSRPLRVLVAERNRADRTLTCRTLVEAGYSVIEASDATEAVHVLQRQKARVDVVLMDVRMPEQDGIEVVRAIHQCEKAQGLRVTILAMAAEMGHGDREYPFRPEVAGYGPNRFDRISYSKLSRLCDGLTC